jgi:single-strand DNA-binding protein
MMNKANFIGRLTRDPELRITNNGNEVINFIIAVNRNTKNEDGTTEADFIPCVAWKKTAEAIGKYLNKGSLVGITGRFESSVYEKEGGEKEYKLNLMVETIDFLSPKKEENN